MLKYLLGILSTLLSFFFGTAVLADSGELLSTSEVSTPKYTIQVLNLPLLQEINKTFTFDLSVSSEFLKTTQAAMLYVDDCGDDIAMSHQGKIRMSIPLTLNPNEKQTFPVTLYRAGVNECILTFKLFDTNQNLLTSAQVGMLPGCVSMRTNPIDQGLDYTLPELETNQTSHPQISTETPKVSTSSTILSITPQENVEQSLVNYTTDERSSAFDLLIEKGYLTPEDKERLQQPLSRIDAAELFVSMAIANELTLGEKVCEFGDTSDLSPQQQQITKLACQYNIMGIHPDQTPLDNFMPNMTIPSEQLVTAFSRLVWRDLYEHTIEEKYYELHMNMMHNLGIIDHQIVDTDQNLADFVIIASRLINNEQFILQTQSEIVIKEKKSFRFW